MPSYRSQYGCNTVRFNDMVNSLAATSCYTPVGGVHGVRHGSLQTFTSAMDLLSSCHYDRPIFDCSWAVNDANRVILASSHGNSYLVDSSANNDQMLAIYDANSDACTFSVHCHADGISFFSAQFDGRIHHWSLDEQIILHTYTHPNVVSCVTSDPRNPNEFSSACDDGMLRIWDIRHPGNPVVNIQADDAPVVFCDWNHHGNRRVLTSSFRKNYVKIWDIARADRPIKVVYRLHYDWIRSVKFSPQREYQFSSASHDTTVAVCDYVHEDDDPVISRYEFHRSRVASVDMSRLVEGQLASCGNDGFIYVWEHAVPEARSSSSPPPPSSSSSST